MLEIECASKLQSVQSVKVLQLFYWQMLRDLGNTGLHQSYY